MVGPTSKRCSSTSHAGPRSNWSWQNDTRAALFDRPRVGDAAALPLSVAELVAAHARAALLADPADVSLGLHEPVSLCQQQLCLSCLRRAARRCYAMGRTVPGPAWPFDVVSRGDVGTQSRTSVRNAV